MSSVTHMLPYTADARVVMQTACLRPVTPDKTLLLGPVQAGRACISRPVVDVRASSLDLGLDE